VIFNWNIKHLIASLLLVILMSGASFGQSQELEAEAYVDTNAILIGEQVLLRLTVTQQFGDIVLWPQIGDTITSAIEVVSRGELDTIKRSGDGTLEISRDYQLTSFDSGYFVVPPFRFTKLEDSTQFAETEAILIEVHTLEVDTTLAIKDIKAPMDVPYTWDEFIPHGLITLGILLLALLTYYLYKRWKNRTIKVVVEEVFVRDPHLVALEDLEALELKKLWQQGNIKPYYTELTDIIRTYIENRFEVIAMEMTSDEIMTSMNYLPVSNTCKEKLQQLLMTADMVKFAKSQPIGSEHELCMANAYLQIGYCPPAS